MTAKPSKGFINPRMERLKDRIRPELGRPLTDHELHLIELSAAILDEENEQESETDGEAA